MATISSRTPGVLDDVGRGEFEPGFEGNVDESLGAENAPVEQSRDRAAESVSQADSPAAASEEFSETNTQEADVGEGDLVKTDGRRLAVAVDNTIRVARVTAAKPRWIGNVKTDGSLADLILRGNQIFAISSTYLPYEDIAIIHPPSFEGTTLVEEFEISKSGLKRVGKVNLEGGYLGTREISVGKDGSPRSQTAIKIALATSGPNLDFGRHWGIPEYPEEPHREAKSRLEENKALIRDSKWSDWLPAIIDPDGSRRDYIDCSNVTIPHDRMGFGVGVVATVGKKLGDFNPAAAVGSYRVLYGSESHMWLAG